MSPVVTMSQLLEAGVHFGHQTRRWNPKMQRFIFGERNGIYLLDLNQTLDCLAAAYTQVRDTVAGGGLVLFVGTKKQTRDSVEQFAERCAQPYVNQRWLGGMLTNFETMAKRVAKMKEYQRMRESGEFDEMPKKEALMLSRELAKLERNFRIRLTVEGEINVTSCHHDSTSRSRGPLRPPDKTLESKNAEVYFWRT